MSNIPKPVRMFYEKYKEDVYPQTDEINQLPYLKLDMRAPFDGILQEVMVNIDFFRSFHDHHKDWKHLILHGISENHNEHSEFYGYGTEAEAPYRWTTHGDSCQVTRSFVEGLPFEHLYRVRFVLLEPGGYMLPHKDLEQPGYTDLNICITQPENCFFIVKGGGCIPFKPGDVYSVNKFHTHSIINMGEEPRIHLMVGGKPSEQFWNMLTKSSKGTNYE